MRKIKLSVFLISLISGITCFGQSLNWQASMGNYIYKYEIKSDRVFIIYGDSDGTKVVKSKRIFPHVAALDKETGNKVWEISNPIEMMGVSEKEQNSGSVKVRVKGVGKTKYIRLGHLMIVNPSDGTVLFNPTENGITEILYSKAFPEGILATAKLNKQYVQLFLSFTTWEIAWFKQDKNKKIKDKINNFLVGMMATDANAKRDIQKELKDSDDGYYFNGDYIIQLPEERAIVSYNLKTGIENWKYKYEKAFSQYLITEDQSAGGVLIYLITQNNWGNKSTIQSLDYSTGNILWQNDVDYSISNLVPLNETASVLVVPKATFGKKYFQIYDRDGKEILEKNGLKSFGTNIEDWLSYNNKLIIVAGSGQKNTPGSIDLGFKNLSLSSTGGATKFREFVNIINLQTKQFVFEKKIKTDDKVEYIKPLVAGLLVIERNQVSVYDYKTGKKIFKPLRSKKKLLYLDDDENTIFVAPEDASALYSIDNLSGQLRQIINLKKKKVKMNFLHELILTDNGIILHGLNKKDDLMFVKVSNAGNLVYKNEFQSPDYQDSWQMPVVGQLVYCLIEMENGTSAVGAIDMSTGEMAHRYYFNIEGGIRENVGHYYVSRKDGTIYHVPWAKSSSPLDKKAKKFNASGIFKAIQY